MKKPVALIIMDGFGESNSTVGNAVKAANTPNLDRIEKTYPTTLIKASGLDVGLPDGQMGNSEVGHTNIGAGRIVYQDLTRITKSIQDGDFFTNEVLNGAMENAKEHALHIMGLLSDGGVHSHIDHLKALIKMAKEKGVERVYVLSLIHISQTITIGAKAVFGSAFNTTKNGSNTLDSRGNAQSNIATITPPTVPIINPSTVSYTDVLTCTHSWPFSIYLINKS